MLQYFTAHQPKLTIPRSRVQLMGIFSHKFNSPKIPRKKVNTRTRQPTRRPDDIILDNLTMRPNERLLMPMRAIGRSMWLTDAKRLTGLKKPMGPAWLKIDPHRYLWKEIPCIPRPTLTKGIPTMKGFYKIHALMKIFLIRKDLIHQETKVSSTLL